MKVLSLFDGMACGMLAMLSVGIKVDRYVAFEIDKYAVQTSSHNFPMIEHRGDVFHADFSEYSGFDFLVGGSPCTYWSIAQKNNRETEASGMGWELFSQYDRALREAQPMYFIYENNKSMANAIRESITQTFGFEPICINSAFVSAQNRQRLYWVGKRNFDGTYSKVYVEQPEDRGILLRDVLDGICGVGQTSDEKSFCLTSSYQFGVSPHDTLEKSRRSMVAESVVNTVLNINPSGKGINGAVGRIDAKSRCLTTNKVEGQKIIVPVAEPINTTADGKSQTIKAQYCKNSVSNFCCYSSTYGASGVAEPVACRCRGRVDKNGNGYAKYECRDDGKANTLDTNTVNGSMLAEPVAEPCIYQVPHGFNDGGIKYEKSPTLTANGSWVENNKVIDVFAIAIEWDDEGKPTKAISGADGKTYPVYEVKDGQITVKGKQYPIKLVDAYYIIRKLTVSECKRLQTVPEWYEFPVSDTQAYKMLGNGWTVEVIAHLINATQCDGLEDEQMDLFKMAVM